MMVSCNSMKKQPITNFLITYTISGNEEEHINEDVIDLGFTDSLILVAKHRYNGGLAYKLIINRNDQSFYIVNYRKKEILSGKKEDVIPERISKYDEQSYARILEQLNQVLGKADGKEEVNSVNCSRYIGEVSDRKGNNTSNVSMWVSDAYISNLDYQELSLIYNIVYEDFGFLFKLKEELLKNQTLIKAIVSKNGRSTTINSTIKTDTINDLFIVTENYPVKHFASVYEDRNRP